MPPIRVRGGLPYTRAKILAHRAAQPSAPTPSEQEPDREAQDQGDRHRSTVRPRSSHDPLALRSKHESDSHLLPVMGALPRTPPMLQSRALGSPLPLIVHIGVIHRSERSIHKINDLETSRSTTMRAGHSPHAPGTLAQDTGAPHTYTCTRKPGRQEGKRSRPGCDRCIAHGLEPATHCHMTLYLCDGVGCLST